jgi:predicted nucleic acid-binding protein
VVRVDEVIADRAGELGREYRRSHPGIGHIDLLIAATAAVQNAALWTLNVEHFLMVADLQPPY